MAQNIYFTQIPIPDFRNYDYEHAQKTLADILVEYREKDVRVGILSQNSRNNTNYEPGAHTEFIEGNLTLYRSELAICSQEDRPRCTIEINRLNPFLIQAIHIVNYK
jgi:hypothetical protein